MMHIFIDANILLGFYQFTSDDLDQLAKLKKAIEAGQATLWMPDQVKDEFARNREHQIAGSLSKLRGQTLSLQFPAICRNYDEYAELRKLQREYQKAHRDLVSRVETQAADNTLKADLVLSDLIKAASSVPTTAALYDRAVQRTEKGNPPGKRGALGDRLNWESLLDAVPKRTDLNLVTEDGDFASALDRDLVHPFLKAEWRAEQDGGLVLHRSLGRFLSAALPTIQLEDDREREELVAALAASRNFHSTHLIVAKLNRYSEFSRTQVSDLADAILNNTQVLWIVGDSDVRAFVERLLKDFPAGLSQEQKAELREQIAEVDRVSEPSIDWDLDAPATDEGDERSPF